MSRSRLHCTLCSSASSSRDFLFRFAMVLLLTFVFAFAAGKVYDRCELARELKYIHKAPDHHLATWVCIAEHESQYNTSIVGHLSGDGSGDHGIFQISDKFWCSPPGKGIGCGLTCAMLEDDEISDDFACAQRIYKEHKILSGDGFNAWAVYTPHCKDWKAHRYIKDCFKEDVNEIPQVSDLPSQFSDFAHGFFGTIAGRSYLTSSTESPIFDAFFTPTTTSYRNVPEENSAFFTTNSVPSPDNNFHTSTVSTPVSFAPTTSGFTASRFFPNPTTKTTTFVPQTKPTFNKSPISQFTSPISTSFPSTSTSFDQKTTTVNKPIFIINGVRWI